MAANQQAGHPWMNMNNEELLRSAGLFIRDYQTGQEGYTLAAVLLLGKDELIQAVLPHYKTDALLRIENTDRYDDRDDIRTNLVESYDRLMGFVAKHLKDKFYLEGNQRISLRDRILREVTANLLVHREFANPYPAKMVIKKNSASTENWNKPHGHGLINPDLFSPFPKNPVIARFFKEIGLVEELGSGIRNAYKYVKLYSGGQEPSFEEGDIFTCTIPLEDDSRTFSRNSNQDSNEDGNQDSNQDKFRLQLRLVKSPGTFLKAMEDFLVAVGNDHVFSTEQLERIRPFLIYKNEYWLPILRECLYPKSRKEIFEAIGVNNEQ